MYMTVRDLIDYATKNNCLDSEIAIKGYDEYGSDTTFYPGVDALRSKYTKGYLTIYVDPVWQRTEDA